MYLMQASLLRLRVDCRGVGSGLRAVYGRHPGHYMGSLYRRTAFVGLARRSI